MVKYTFADLRIEAEFFAANNSRFFRRLVELGYGIIAANSLLNEEDQQKKIRHKKEIVIPQIEIPKNVTNLKILKRITIEFSTLEFLELVFKNPKMKDFDLIAMVCSNIPVLIAAIKRYKCDIISYNPINRFAFKSKKDYESLFESGMFFEIMYTPIIQTESTKTTSMETARDYNVLGLAKNVIITSGARNDLNLRGPYDLFAMCSLFDLDRNGTKKAIAQTVNRLLNKISGTSDSCEEKCAVPKPSAVTPPQSTEVIVITDSSEIIEIDCSPPKKKKKRKHK